MGIVIGIDAHKQTHTAAAVDETTGRSLATVTVAADELGHRRLLEFGRGLGGELVWALEDCRHVTGGVERFLLRVGEHVVRVHPALAAEGRKVAREPGKSDEIDANAIARTAIREPDLPVAYLPGPEREIAWLVDYRAHLVAERTRLAGRLRWVLHDLDPQLQPPARGLDNPNSLDKLELGLAQLASTGQVRICRRMIARVRDLNSEIKSLERELGPMVRLHHAPLLAIPGCGVITAARLIAEIANISRFSSDAKLANYAGVAPIPASSGKRQRHRLNRAGNRQLNSAFHVIALTQARMHPPARDYLARRRANGGTPKDGLRALKRHIARHVFHLFNDIHTHQNRPRLEVSTAPLT
jgi:transposase